MNEYLITLTDAVGKVVYKKSGAKSRVAIMDLIDIKSLKSGMYILQFSNKDQKVTRKIMKL